MQTKNPATGEITKIFSELTDSELESKLAKAASAYADWKHTDFATRATLMLKLGSYLRENSDRLAGLATLEMGKTKSAAKMEVEKCAAACEFYAQNAEKFLAPETINNADPESFVQFDSIGVVLAVMPWNFPYWQVYRFAAPAIMAGNVGVLKHASNVPQCAEAIEESFRAAGFPEGVFQNLLIGSARVEKVIRDPRVVAITLTGSEKAGSEVAKTAGAEIKKTVLELGGSDPFIVFEDADVALAAQTAAASRMQNNAGQSCIAAKRFIVQSGIADQFTKLLIAEFEKMVVGDPLNLDTNVGPLATEQILLDVEKQVKDSIAKGAKVEFGAKRIGNLGNYYTPTVLSAVKKGMPVYDEEVFGPVAPIIIFSTEAEAIEIANDTPYGLGATVFTKDLATARKLTSQIDAGNVFINGQVKSDTRAPFGGIKKSGYGRELSQYGIREFVNIKHVWMK